MGWSTLTVSLTLKFPFFYTSCSPHVYIIYPRTFDKDRCNPQAETERVEAQNRKLLAENQKVMFLVALDILTDREANWERFLRKLNLLFS